VDLSELLSLGRSLVCQRCIEVLYDTIGLRNGYPALLVGEHRDFPLARNSFDLVSPGVEPFDPDAVEFDSQFFEAVDNAFTVRTTLKTVQGNCHVI